MPFTYQSGEEIKKATVCSSTVNQVRSNLWLTRSSAILQWIGMSRRTVEASW